MLRKVFIGAAIFSSALLLTACYDQGLTPEASLVPSDYSPDYTYVTKVSEDGRIKRVLVPEACLSIDAQSPADIGPERLPPGCANNYNLQRMVERKRDLRTGRPLGAAPAAPAARAAQNYIDGKKQETLGGGFRKDTEYAGDGAAVAAQAQGQ